MVMVTGVIVLIASETSLPWISCRCSMIYLREQWKLAALWGPVLLKMSFSMPCVFLLNFPGNAFMAFVHRLQWLRWPPQKLLLPPPGGEGLSMFFFFTSSLMLHDNLGDCKDKDKQDDYDCVPPLWNIVSCSLNLDCDDGCKGGYAMVTMHT